MSVAMDNSTSSDPTAIARLAALAEAALQTYSGGAIGTDPDLAPFAVALHYPLAAGGNLLNLAFT